MEVFAYLLSRLPSSCLLYMVGGSSRDFLLKREFSDFDFAISLTPDEIRKTKLNDIPKIDFSFTKYGIVNVPFEDKKITLASFRKESDYEDLRHPHKVELIKDPYIDSFRRDFTINAIYINKDLEVYDPQNGLIDLHNKTIRMIGNIDKRIKEDPLRMIRAYRFSLTLGFDIEPSLKSYLDSHKELIDEINPRKVEMEIEKVPSDKQDELKRLIFVLK